jgi:hypothetical protein
MVMIDDDGWSTSAGCCTADESETIHTKKLRAA